MSKNVTIKVGDYTLLKKIGAGNYGTIWEAISSKDQKKYAVKQLDKVEITKDATLHENFQAEVAIMQSINGWYIIRLYDFLESQKYYYLAMQQCSDGDLTKYMKKRGIKHFTEKESIFFLEQISVAFKRLHKDKVMHRDFKLDNIFIDNGNVVLGDQGFAKMGSESSDEQLGTPYYMAPEIFEGKVYTNQADLWSVGVSFYELQFGQQPFLGRDMKDLYNNIKKQSGDNMQFPQAINDISEDCQNLIKKILQVDLKKRMTWEEFFNHPLFDEEKQEQRKVRLGDFLSRFVVKKANQEETNTKFQNLKYDVMDSDTMTLFSPKDMGFKAKASPINEVELHRDNTGVRQIFANMEQEDEVDRAIARIKHETQKIDFMWQALDELGDLINTGNFGDFSKAEGYSKCTCLLSTFLAAKAKTMWYLNMRAYEKKQNIFGLKDHLKVFESEKFQEIQKLGHIKKAEYQTYWEMMIGYLKQVEFKRDDQFELEKIYSTNMMLPSIDALIQRELNEYMTIFDSKVYGEFDAAFKRKMCVNMIYVYYSQNCEQSFKWDDAWRNFDWINLYTKHEEKVAFELERFIKTRFGKDYMMVEIKN